MWLEYIVFAFTRINDFVANKVPLSEVMQAYVLKKGLWYRNGNRLNEL